MNSRFFTHALMAILVLGVVSPAIAPAQTRDDAVRFSESGLGVGARALGMGGAYTGVANDYSALYWNPAGLAQVRMNEFSAGLSTDGFNNTGTFFGTDVTQKMSGTNLNSIGLLYAIPTSQGSASVAFGYQRHSSFRRAMGFDAFNPLSSIVQSWAPNGEVIPPDTTLAEKLGLASVNSNGRFVSPINGRGRDRLLVIRRRDRHRQGCLPRADADLRVGLLSLRPHLLRDGRPGRVSQPVSIRYPEDPLGRVH
jgi:hypothetical protein